MKLLKQFSMILGSIAIVAMIVLFSPLSNIFINYFFYSTGDSPVAVPEITASKIPDQQGTWTLDETGWSFHDRQNQKAADKTANIGGVDYLFNKDGYMETGWTEVDDTWYYLSYSGHRETGWIKTDAKAYYLDKDGQMVTGWQTIENKKYHFKKDGTLSQGWIKQKGNYYYIESDGTPHTGWLVDGETYYYLDAAGVMQTGWIKDADSWYYMNPSGDMTTGWQTIDQKSYYFSEMGVLHTGWLEDNNKTYFFDNDGYMTKGWVQLGDYKYYMDPGSGAMRTGWVVDQKKAYYLNSKGILEANPKTAPAGGAVALTFDGGPGQYTDRILNTLENTGSKASFFVLGKLVDNYPDTLKRMQALGCDIGAQSYDGINLSGLGKKEIKAQIKKTSKKVKALTGKGISLVRPAGGSYGDEVRSSLSNPFILWSLDSQDEQNKNAAAIAEMILNKVTNGDILLLHDTYGTTAEAVEILVPALTSTGYKVTSVKQLASLKGSKLEKKQLYKSFP